MDAALYAALKSDRNLQFATKQPQAGLYAKNSWLGVWVKVSLSMVCYSVDSFSEIAVIFWLLLCNRHLA